MISIHAPREGSDRVDIERRVSVDLFQSTLPARGATMVDVRSMAEYIISIHAPREGSDHVNDAGRQARKISIHAPREGSDVAEGNQILFVQISIHAPREGSDWF